MIIKINMTLFANRIIRKKIELITPLLLPVYSASLIATENNRKGDESENKTNIEYDFSFSLL